MLKKDRTNNNISNIVRQILIKRGLKEEEFDEFLSSSPQLAYDPFLLSGMREAVNLLVETIDNGDKIMVYGDYDVDGVTSVAIMMRALRTITDNVDYYIPSRIDEGYGLNKDAIKKIRDDGYKLLITVDCGIVSLEETKYARSIGLDTIITDHHNPGDVVACGIVINPKLAYDEYPFKGLAGVGVAYKFICAINTAIEIPREIIVNALELVALGTIADLMPLIDENRTIIKYGIKLMKRSCNLGISKLIEVSGIDRKKITATDISFRIAPRINAAGRIKDASIGVKLLLTDNEEEAGNIALELDQINTRRKAYQDLALRQCITKATDEIKKGDFILIKTDDCHEGILGIVAGRIKDEFERPTIIVQKNNDETDEKIIYKGTGRSRGKIDLYKMLLRNRDCLIKFGGHSAACGFTIEEDKIDELRTRLNNDIKSLLLEDNNLLDEDLDVDLTIEPYEIDLGLAYDLLNIEPCGKGNPKPVFMLKNVAINSWRTVGSSNDHAIFEIENIRCIHFNFNKSLMDKALNKDKVTSFDVIGHIDVNEWNGNQNVQIRVLEIIPHER